MISYELYKLLHVLGILLIMVAVGGAAAHAFGGGERRQNPQRGLLLAAHGFGLVLVLVAGFGMLARLELDFGGGWLFAKIGIWLLLGSATLLAYKVPFVARWAMVIFPLLGMAAAYLARFKPF
jgi:hypothetical protein